MLYKSIAALGSQPTNTFFYYKKSNGKQKFLLGRKDDMHGTANREISSILQKADGWIGQ